MALTSIVCKLYETKRNLSEHNLIQRLSIENIVVDKKIITKSLTREYECNILVFGKFLKNRMQNCTA